MKRLYLLCVLLAGCAGAPQHEHAQEVAGMLARYESLAAAKPEDQRRELVQAQAAHDQLPSDTTRLNLALVLLLPQAPWRDDSRAMVLLSNVEATDRPSARHSLAQLLMRFIAERQRLQRTDQRKADQLSAQLREERHKSEDLQQKIDSLRAIDRDTRVRRRDK